MGFTFSLHLLKSPVVYIYILHTLVIILSMFSTRYNTILCEGIHKNCDIEIFASVPVFVAERKYYRSMSCCLWSPR